MCRIPPLTDHPHAGGENFSESRMGLMLTTSGAIGARVVERRGLRL
jgi:hypothetical protein